MDSLSHHVRSRHHGEVAPRLAIFLAIISVPFFWFGYVFVSETRSGGVERHAGFADVDLKALGHFSFDESNGTLRDVPVIYRNLDGRRVRLEGFMVLRNNAGDHVNSFEFVYNRTTCCIIGPPRVQERVFVNVPNGDVPYSDDMVRIEGILHVNVLREAGIVKSVYTLDLERVIPS